MGFVANVERLGSNTSLGLVHLYFPRERTRNVLSSLLRCMKVAHVHQPSLARNRSRLWAYHRGAIV
jgi:hypothetical protein